MPIWRRWRSNPDWCYTLRMLISRVIPGLPGSTCWTEIPCFARGLPTLFAAHESRRTLDNGEVAHVRPSGNADELGIYAVADTQARADEITKLGVAEPDGILRQLERALA